MKIRSYYVLIITIAIAFIIPFSGIALSENNRLIFYPNGINSSIAKWHLDEGNGLTAYDSIRNHHATLVDIVWKSDCYANNCLEFNGEGSYMSVPDHDDFDGMQTLDLSFRLWLSSVNSGGKDTIVKKYAGSGGSFEVYFYNDDFPNSAVRRTIGFHLNAGYGTASVTSINHRLTSNRWYLIRIVFDGTNMKVYVDSELSWQYTPTITVMPIINDAPLIFGNGFWGRLDEVKVKQYDSPSVYLPLVTNKYVNYPPANITDHFSDYDGGITINLPDGTMGEFQFLDVLDQPISDVPVVAIENETGITLIMSGVQQGFYPQIFSIPADEYPSAMVGLNSPTWLFPVKIHIPGIEEGVVSLFEKLNLSYGHIESLHALRSQDYQTIQLTGAEVCNEARNIYHVPYLYSILYPQLSEGRFGVYVPGVVQIIKTEVCELALNEQQSHRYMAIRNRTVHRVSTINQSQIYILSWEESLNNPTGIVIGQVIDVKTGLGLSNAHVMLDGIPSSTYVTSINGWYRFDGVSGGTHYITASRDGYTSSDIPNVNVLPNVTSEVVNIVMQVDQPGTWRINNDTTGYMTVQINDVGIRIFSPGTHDWELPAGIYNYIAWTTACGGEVNSTVEIDAGWITFTRFYCGQVSNEPTSFTIEEYKP